MTLTHLDLFSGIGGFALAANRLKIKTQQFVEIDPFCRSVLQKHFPSVPCHDDIKTFEPLQQQYDLITAGFPCQDISQANSKRKGLAGERSGLFFEIIRLVRKTRPRYVLLENSAALLNSNRGRDMGTILWHLAECGLDAEWSVLSACSMGAPHTRERLFIVAYSHGINVQGRMAIQERNNQQLQAVNEGPRSNVWARTVPSPPRVSNRIPRRVDRLRSLGNAVVPDVAAIALKRILEIEQNTKITQ